MIKVERQSLNPQDASWGVSRGFCFSRGGCILPLFGYFTIGKNVHDAFNNILALKGAEVDGKAHLAAKWTKVNV